MTNFGFYKIGNAQCPPLAEFYYNTFGEITDGTYVEVGAFNGVNWSATYALAKLGWTGLLFEPQKDKYNECRLTYTHFKNVNVVNCAILDREEKVKLYLGGSLSTTSEERVKAYQEIWWAISSRLDLTRYVEVQAYRLDAMLKKYSIPKDFEVLIVDAEGAEARVLNSMSLGEWKPILMMIETHETYEDERLSRTGDQVMEILEPFGYEKLYANHINTVYRRKDWHEFR